MLSAISLYYSACVRKFIQRLGPAVFRALYVAAAPIVLLLLLLHHNQRNVIKLVQPAVDLLNYIETLLPEFVSRQAFRFFALFAASFFLAAFCAAAAVE